MYTKSATFTNEWGLNSRFAAYFIQKSRNCQSVISMEYGGRKVNGKSLLGILSLGVRKGAEVQVSADGPDETEAADALCEMIRNAGEFAGDSVKRENRKAEKKPGLFSRFPIFRGKRNKDAEEKL